MISSPKYSLFKQNISSFRCDFGSVNGIDKSTSYLLTSNKSTHNNHLSIGTPTINLNNILSLSNINTFLIRSPQSIHKEKRIEYTMVFRNGSMKDLHRKNYLINLSTMKASQRDDSIQ